MPLSLAQKGVVNSIKKVGGKDALKKHLQTLGFIEGGNVSVVSQMGGSVIVNVKDARIAISREMANKIII